MRFRKLNALLSCALALSTPSANALGLIIGQPMPMQVRFTAPRPVPAKKNEPGNMPLPKHRQQQALDAVPVPEAQPEPKTKTVPKPAQKNLNKHHEAASRIEPKRLKQPVSKQMTDEAKPDDLKPSIIVDEQTNLQTRQLDARNIYGARLISEQVRTEITGNVAKTLITETFKNDSNHIVSGTYLFPLPKDAAFNSLTLYIDGQPVKGKLLEASEARREYETIVRLMVDPALLEYADYKTVRAKMFPIPPQGTKKIQLEYTQLLKAENGMMKYEFPLKADNRECPIEDVQLDVHIVSTNNIKSVWLPAYKIATVNTKGNQADISLRAKNITPAQNFSVLYSSSDKAFAADVVAYKESSPGDGYFLLSLSPPVQAEETLAKDLLLIADTSGSMSGSKIQQVKSSLKFIVGVLADADRFNIVTFGTDVSSFMPGLVAATPQHRKDALAFIDRIQAKGGTNFSKALSLAVDMVKGNNDRPSYMLITSDGIPTVGQCDPLKIVELVPSPSNLRIFDLGIGNDVSPRLLDRLAELHHGVSQYVDADENIEKAISNLYKQIQKPVLTDVQVKIEGVQTKDLYPSSAIDIFAGDQNLILGRYSGQGKANVIVSGKRNGQTKTYSFPVQFTSAENGNTEVARLWAMRRIGVLCDLAENSRDKKQLVDEIVALSTKFGLVSPYSSFLATDPRELRIGVSRESINVDGSDLHGLEAVRRSKLLSAYKSSSHLPGEKSDLRIIAGKSFYLKEGIWMDASYDEAAWKKPELVEFGSRKYFDLVANDFRLSRYFSVGRQVLVVHDGHCYKVTDASGASTI
jgi:Ca-activated chloride channel homolog